MPSEIDLRPQKKGLTFWLSSVSFIGTALALVSTASLDDGQTLRFSEMGMSFKFVTIWGLLGILVLWGSMLYHYFAFGDRKQRVLWGFVLFLGMYFGAVVYFIVKFIPSNLVQNGK